MPCENQIDTVTWWRSMKFRQKSFISLSLATKREIWKSESMRWKTILNRSFWYQKFEDPTIHVTVAIFPKFWGLKFQHGFTHTKLRGRDSIFRYCPIIPTSSFTWAGQNKFSTTLQISGFISTESTNCTNWDVLKNFLRTIHCESIAYDSSKILIHLGRPLWHFETTNFQSSDFDILGLSTHILRFI